MLAKMIDKIVALKETKTFEIAGQTYADSPGSRPTSTGPTASASAASMASAS